MIIKRNIYSELTFKNRIYISHISVNFIYRVENGINERTGKTASVSIASTSMIEIIRLFVFNIDLSLYGKEFMLITFGSISLVFIAVFSAVTITMRLQKRILISYIMVSIVTIPFVLLLVVYRGMTGAAYFSLIMFMPLMISYYIIYRVALKVTNIDKMGIK